MQLNRIANWTNVLQKSIVWLSRAFKNQFKKRNSINLNINVRLINSNYDMHKGKQEINKPTRRLAFKPNHDDINYSKKWSNKCWKITMKKPVYNSEKNLVGIEI